MRGKYVMASSFLRRITHVPMKVRNPFQALSYSSLSSVAGARFRKPKTHPVQFEWPLLPKLELQMKSIPALSLRHWCKSCDLVPTVLQRKGFERRVGEPSSTLGSKVLSLRNPSHHCALKRVPPLTLRTTSGSHPGSRKRADYVFVDSPTSSCLPF